jgi:hypothetical protein
VRSLVGAFEGGLSTAVAFFSGRGLLEMLGLVV